MYEQGSEDIWKGANCQCLGGCKLVVNGKFLSSDIQAERVSLAAEKSYCLVHLS